MTSGSVPRKLFGTKWNTLEQSGNRATLNWNDDREKRSRGISVEQIKSLLFIRSASGNVKRKVFEDVFHAFSPSLLHLAGRVNLKTRKKKRKEKMAVLGNSQKRDKRHQNHW